MYIERASQLAHRIFINGSYKSFVTIKKVSKGNQNLAIITASDATHELSLLQLLTSIRAFEPYAQVIVFDLGLSKKGRTLLLQFGKKINLTVIPFPFEDYPKWMAIANPEKGSYAWKSICITIAIRNLIENLENSYVMWLDAGCFLTGSLKKIKRIIGKRGFWTTTASGNLRKWCYPTLIKKLNIDKKILDSRILAAGVFGFSLRSKVAINLLEDWLAYCSDRELISPPGSNRSNHRQDQTLFTYCVYKQGLAPSKRNAALVKDCILTHCDIDLN